MVDSDSSLKNCMYCGLRLNEQLYVSNPNSYSEKQNNSNIQCCYACNIDIDDYNRFSSIIIAKSLEILSDKSDVSLEDALEESISHVSQILYWKNSRISPPDKSILIMKLKTVCDMINFYPDMEQFTEEIEDNIQYEVFISHRWTSPAEIIVAPIIEDLQARGYKIWFDRNLWATETGIIQKVLDDAINRCRFFLFFGSRDYFDSKNCLFELDKALNSKIKSKIIPIWWDDVSDPILNDQIGNIDSRYLCLQKELTGLKRNDYKDIIPSLSKIDSKQTRRLVDKLETIIIATDDHQEYGGVILGALYVSAMCDLEKIIGEPIPCIGHSADTEFNNMLNSRREGNLFGFFNKNDKIIGLVLRKTSGGLIIPPLALPSSFIRFAPFLELFDAPIVAIPAEFHRFCNLKYLSIFGGYIHSISDSLFQSTIGSLMYLDVTRNPLGSIGPYVLDKLKKKGSNDIKFDSELKKKLEEETTIEEADIICSLKFVMELITGAPLENFEYLFLDKKLIKLNLNKNQLISLPEMIGLLKSLTSLDLQYNKLFSLPDTIGNPTQLNELSTLPEGIGSLEKLQILNLKHNNLYSFPDKIYQLGSLQALNLCGNKINSFPKTFGQMKSIKLLDLSYNKFSNLPESIDQLVNLQTLNLCGNRLISLPESIRSLVSLQILNLSNNLFFSLPASMGSLIHLETLDLSHNQLTSFPEFIFQLKSIETLDLSYNRISSLPENIDLLVSLKILNLDNNALVHIPEIIKSHLMKLKKSGCEILGINFGKRN